MPSSQFLRLARSPFNSVSRIPASPARGQIRTASANASKARRKGQTPSAKRKKKASSDYDAPDLRNAIQFSLIDAMRYIRAAEVGRAPRSSKYELHVRLKTPKSGAIVRNRLRLPHPVKSDIRICVIAPPDSAAEKAARAAGAAVIGEDTVIDAVKEGRIEFDRCLCHPDSLGKLTKAGVGRILGPKGLMPSVKTNTVVKDVAAAVREMSGASEYRERVGVVRMSVGQLGFTPEELQKNIRAFIEAIKKDIGGLSDRITKTVHEVVLSSTNGPGLSLNGDLKSENSPDPRDLSTL